MSFAPRIRMAGLACCLAVSWSCRDATAPLPPEQVMEQTVPAPDRVLTGDAAFGQLKRIAPFLAARGDSSPLYYVLERERKGLEPEDGPRLSRVESDDPADRIAIIYDYRVLASLNPDNSFVYATMTHDGHVGKIELNYTISRQDGTVVSRFGPETQTRINPLGKWNRQNVDLLVNIASPGSCGFHLLAWATFQSYYVGNPWGTIDAGPVDIPEFRGPITYKSASGESRQSDCPIPTGGPGGGGGGGGDGGGYYLTYTSCWGFDVYSDGQYVYSVVLGCSSYSVYVNGGENQT